MIIIGIYISNRIINPWDKAIAAFSPVGGESLRKWWRDKREIVNCTKLPSTSRPIPETSSNILQHAGADKMGKENWHGSNVNLSKLSLTVPFYGKKEKLKEDL